MRAIATGDATWGIGESVQEPATATSALAAGPGVKVDARVVGALGVSDKVSFSEGWPAARSWTLTITARKLVEGPVIIEPPRCFAEIEYGTGSGQYTLRIEVPTAGLVWAVQAQWVSVRTFLAAPRVVPPVPVRIDLQIVPGSPRTLTLAERLFYDGSSPAVLRAPRGARAVAVATVEYIAGSPTTVTLGTGEFLYQDVGPLSVRSPVLPLAQTGGGVTLVAVGSRGVFLPADANAIRVQAGGVTGWHHVEWEIQT